MRKVRFGIIGCGLMGREFASAAARWCHLSDMAVAPEIVAVCSATEHSMQWFTQNLPGVKMATTNYHELLANPEVEAVYIAVPHNLHAEIYSAAIRAGKHLMGEKPFGIDLTANQSINKTMQQHPEVFARCSSEFPFFPGVQRLGALVDDDFFGDIFEVESGFLHSSDLDPGKLINWKRMIEINGEYGVLGDLGMHACHFAFRAGWQPKNVRAILSDIIRERPDSSGKRVSCETWDNATLLCEAVAAGSSNSFPWSIKVQRIAPGEKNTWYISVKGTKGAARWSSKHADVLKVLRYEGGSSEQVWGEIQTGHETAFKTITGGIFEFGFSDSILQMWAAFLHELHYGTVPRRFAGCVTPTEVALSHRLFTAALNSHTERKVVKLDSII